MYGQFFILFAMIVVGYYGYRKGWLTREVNKGLGGLVMQATIPAMLVTTIANIEITNDILVSVELWCLCPWRQTGRQRRTDG